MRILVTRVHTVHTVHTHIIIRYARVRYTEKIKLRFHSADITWDQDRPPKRISDDCLSKKDHVYELLYVQEVVTLQKKY